MFAGHVTMFGVARQWSDTLWIDVPAEASTTAARSAPVAVQLRRPPIQEMVQPDFTVLPDRGKSAIQGLVNGTIMVARRRALRGAIGRPGSRLHMDSARVHGCRGMTEIRDPLLQLPSRVLGPVFHIVKGNARLA